jgi:hypothetical protein
VRRSLVSLTAALSLERSIAQDAASPELNPRFSGSLEIAVADKYIYHGFILENQRHRAAADRTKAPLR